MADVVAVPGGDSEAGEMTTDDFPARPLIRQKDDVVVGWTADELSAMGRGEPIGTVSDELQRAGQLPAWQYATKKDNDGSLKMMPLRRIVVFSSGTARIEPYDSPLPVLPPS